MEKKTPNNAPKRVITEKKSYSSDKPAPKAPKASTQPPPAPKKK